MFNVSKQPYPTHHQVGIHHFIHNKSMVVAGSLKNDFYPLFCK